MACALGLSDAGLKSIIIEKDGTVGGLAKTLVFKEGKYAFRTDIGPHRFFSKNRKLYEMIEGLLGKDWIKVKRQTCQLIEGKFYDYPINLPQAFRQVGAARTVKMGISYMKGTVKYKLLGKRIENFEDFVIANFGRELGEFNMLNYSQKVWGIPCSQIHPDWGEQRIKGLNLISALSNAVFKNETPRSIVDVFYYPKFGTGEIYTAMEEKVIKKGTKIFKNSFPQKIIHDGPKITRVVWINGKKKAVLDPETLVSSIPITEFLNLLSPKPPQPILDSLNKLRWRAQVYLLITIDKERVTGNNWIYIPEKKFNIGRITEMKNFSDAMSPKGKTSLFIEFFVTEGDRTWNKSREEVFEMAIKELEGFGLAKRSEVRNYYLFKKRKVYPVYGLKYKKDLEKVKGYLDQFKNLYYIGRPGRYKYTNQDHSLEMGLLAAKGIKEGRHYDLDAVGGEKEHFEKLEAQNPKTAAQKRL